MVQYGVVLWCGVMCYGMVSCFDVLWCGLLWYSVIWCGIMCGVLWYGVKLNGMILK